jgi:glycosyltransferase involved in cell wall biosynthesis
MTTDEVSGNRLKITTIIPTLNEMRHVERSVQSALQLGPVFVLDSQSTDETRSLAERAGATVVVQPWLGYARQKNWALENLPITTEWILFLDADEWITEELAAEIWQRVDGAVQLGFYLARRNIFLKRELKHAWWYPDYQLRLFRLGAGRYENREVHEHIILEGEAGFLKNALMHENVKGIDEFMRRHEKYAAMEAREIVQRSSGLDHDQRSGSFRGSWPDRRRALKVKVWYRLPARPAIRFVWMYILRRGFLDGRQGLVYCQLLASYEALIDAKILEIELEQTGPATNG